MKALVIVLGRFTGILLIGLGVLLTTAQIVALALVGAQAIQSIHEFVTRTLLFLSILCLGCLLLYACRKRISRTRAEWYQIEQINDSFQAGNDEARLPSWVKFIYLACSGLTFGLAVLLGVLNEYVTIGDPKISDAEYYAKYYAQDQAEMNMLRFAVAVALVASIGLWTKVRNKNPRFRT